MIVICPPSCCFNPRPLPWERATAPGRAPGLHREVSIRARSRGSGRPDRHAAARVAHEVSIRARSRGSGRPAAVAGQRHTVDVSIRARSRGSGRPAPGVPRPMSSRFQSAPAPVGAGDSGPSGGGSGGGNRFNPRPLPWERATRAPRSRCGIGRVSIRARSRGSGRPCARRTTSSPSRFNPRPLPWERATRWPNATRAPAGFQSAPAPVGAGDTVSPSPCFSIEKKRRSANATGDRWLQPAYTRLHPGPST